LNSVAAALPLLAWYANAGPEPTAVMTGTDALARRPLREKWWMAEA